MHFFWRDIPGVGTRHIVSRREQVYPRHVLLLGSWEYENTTYDLYQVADEWFTGEEIETIRVQYTEPAQITEIQE